MSDTTPAAAPAKKRSRTLILVTAVLVLLLGGGGGAYYWMVAAKPAAEGEHAPEPEHEPAEEAGIVPMPPFVVNLADAGGASFLRVTLAAVVAGEEHAKEIEEDKVLTMRMRSAILEHLALQSGAQLVTPDGKAALKKALIEQLGHIVHETKVTDVLFSEFVVQF